MSKKNGFLFTQLFRFVGVFCGILAMAMTCSTRKYRQHAVDKTAHKKESAPQKKEQQLSLLQRPLSGTTQLNTQQMMDSINQGECLAHVVEPQQLGVDKVAPFPTVIYQEKPFD